MFINLENETSVDNATIESEQEVTDFILENITKNDEGRDVVPIPWFSRYKSLLTSNEKLAYNVLLSVKRKFINTDVLKRIDEVFQTQLENNIIDKIEDFSEFKSKFPSYSFISHSPVIKEDRDTTKVRIIYMANLAEKQSDGTKGVNLNQCIHPGYNKNFKINDALTMTRFDEYILGFDISKAFHRLAIDDENSSKFLFYWFKNVHEGDFTPIVYRSKRVIFGMSVSPFLLQCSLFKMLVVDSDDNDSNGKIDLKKRIYQGSYVDNFFVGCDSEDDVKFVFKTSREIFEGNKFPLQQYVTNYVDFQKQLDVIQNSDTPNEVKILGMGWNRLTDVIIAPKVKLDDQAKTSRQILSSVMKVYDLNNANLPLLNRCKIFLRNLQCSYKDKWDQIIQQSEIREWKSVVSQFNSYEVLEVSRFVGKRNSVFDILMMCDASKDFIGCVLYLKDLKSN